MQSTLATIPLPPKLPEAAGRQLLSTGQPRQRLAELYTDYAQLVAWVASRLPTRPEEVEDVVQEVFLIAASNLHTLVEPPKIRSWFKTVTVRRVGRRLRWARLRSRLGIG